jgi:hypothetical protein
MRYIQKIIIGTTVMSAITYGAPPCQAKRPNRVELAQKMAQAIELNQKAQKQLEAQLDTVSGWVREFYTRYRRYPLSQPDIQFFQTKLSALLPANPYLPPAPPASSEEPLLAQCVNLLDPKPKEDERIEVKIDPGLNASLSAGNSPPASWSAAPGTIVVQTNGYDLCAIWAAGCDGRPIVRAGRTAIWLAARS